MNSPEAVRVPARVWSAYQLAIFREVAEGKGHTVVRARAGSGKTSTIMEAMKHVPAGKKAKLDEALSKGVSKRLGV